jgi:hypothetical protein
VVLGTNPDDVPEIPKQKFNPKSASFRLFGVAQRSKFVACSERHNIEYSLFVESVVPDLVEHVCQESRPKTLRGIMVDMDNARPHSSKKSEAALIVTKSGRIPAPAYSPDRCANDFFLFGMLKERMLGTFYNSPDELISAINELIASLPKDQHVSVYKNWMKRLN